MVTRIRAWNRDRATESGYTIVEFALASILFLTITLGTFDLGRSIYLYSELHSAARDAAREAKVGIANGYGFSQSSINHRMHWSKNLINGVERTRPGLGAATTSYSCSGSCDTGDELTVEGDLPFQAVLQGFLGISPFTVHASATVILE